MKIINDSVFEDIYVSKSIYEGFQTAGKTRGQTGEYRVNENFFIDFNEELITVSLKDSDGWKTKDRKDFYDLSYGDFLTWLEEDDWYYMPNDTEEEYIPLF